MFRSCLPLQSEPKLILRRVSTFDAAFQSRIHISLEYRELDHTSRKTVWQNFLKQHDVTQAAARDRPSKPSASAAKAGNAVEPTPSTAVDGAAEKEAKDVHHSRTHPHKITSKELDKLCQMNMNGRQIKNILKTAQLLASKRGEGLSYEHISTVMDVTQHLHNTTQESERARASFFH